MRQFEPLQDEFYPGSKIKRRESQEMKRDRLLEERRQEKEDEPWDAHPLEIWYQGKQYEMFRIGALGKALGKDSVTIRSWIRKGWLPRNSFQTAPVRGTRGDAGRRLWTRAQIEGIVRIAREEGLLEEKPPQMTKTNFTKRVIAEWKTWR